MQHQSLAQPAQETTGYVLRGLGIAELYAEEMLDDYQGGGRWLVPSGTVEGRSYEVRVSTTRPERSRCECVGFVHHQHCSHVVAAARIHTRSAVCDSCGKRRWRSEIAEVHEEDLLSWYPGDLLCADCIRSGAWV